MKVELKIDNNYKTPLCVIYTDQITEEIKSYITKLSCTTQNTVTGKSGDDVSIINQNDIINIYASNGEVFAVTDRGEFTVTQRLYELENSLDYNKFVRISKSEIINLEKVSRFNLKISGTVYACCVLSYYTTACFYTWKCAGKETEICRIWGLMFFLREQTLYAFWAACGLHLKSVLFQSVLAYRLAFCLAL